MASPFCRCRFDKPNRRRTVPAFAASVRVGAASRAADQVLGEQEFAGHAAGTERALWAAVLRLEERSRLHQVLAETAEDQGYPISAGGFRASARSAHSAARKIRKLLEAPGEAGTAGAAEDDIDD